MESRIDFAKIAFNAVKRNITKGHTPDLVDTIMDDYVSGGGFYGFYHSFKSIADEVGLSTAKLIFDEFLEDDMLTEYVSIWEKAQVRDQEQS
jgi:hypothetical protein